MEKREGELFRYGVVSGTHGLRGDLKIRAFSGDSNALEDAAAVFLRHPDGAVFEHSPERVVPHKGQLLLRLQGLCTIEAVQPLVGCEVLMRFEDLAELPESEFYWFELEGMAVVDQVLGDLGTLKEIFTTAAHDIYVVRGRFGEVLIPVVDDFIVEVDREGRRILVDLPEGLVQDTE